MRRPGSALLPGAVLVALLGVCFARLAADPTGLIVDGRHPSVDHANHGIARPLGNDVTFVFLPHHLQVASRLRSLGRLPAWDPSGFGGRPMVGNPQAGLFYPPVWITWWAEAPSILGWLTVTHLLWGGLGVYLLARGEGLGRWPATLAAAVFQASPYLLAQTFEGHYPHVWSVCWFPWAFLALLELLAGRPRGLFCLPPILALALLAGHPQECLLLILALSCWVVGQTTVSATRGEIRNAVRGLLGWSVALGVGLGLAAIELLPDACMLPWLRKEPLADAAMALHLNYELKAHGALQLLSPWALGGPADYFGPDNLWETLFSFCLIPFVLIIAGVRASLEPAGGRGPSNIRGWVMLALFSAWFAGGPSLGLYTGLHTVVPGIGLFRVPARSLFLTSLAAAILAGFGLDALLARTSHQWRRFGIRLARVGALAIGFLILASLPPRAPDGREPARRAPLAAVGQADSRRPGDAATTNAPTPRDVLVRRAAGRILADPRFGLTVGLLGMAVGLGCSGWTRRRLPHPAHLVGILAIVELAVQGYSFIQVSPAGAFLGPDPVSEAILRLTPGDPSGAPPRVRARDSFYQDLQAARHGIEKTNVNDLFQLGHPALLYESLYAVADELPSRPANELPPSELEKRQQIRQGVFDRMAVSYLVSDRREDDPPWPVAATGTAADGRPFVIQRNPNALPRAYVVPFAEVIAQDGSLLLSRLPDVDPRRAVILDSDPFQGTPTIPRQPFTPARWLGRDPDRPAVEVTTAAQGLLVIAETWMPGWSARLNGVPVPVLRGNHCQQVIPLRSPGSHRIELEYHPPGLRTGAIISTLSAMLWAGLSACAVIHPRRASPVNFDTVE
ncbi:MAG: hypothetical protein U0790_05380 [Isosphaeraceae bacterium]